VVQDAVVKDQRSEVERTYREQRDRLWRALLAFTGDPDVAGDALAEAFAQLISRGAEVRSPDAWVWTAAFRIAAGEMGRRRTSELTGTESPYELPEPVDHLVRALALIPRAQRLAVVLHDYADRPTDEVASILGVTRATVHVHLSRGRKRLRRLLGEQSDG
jgi:RNA polymerase sigma-70 factor (ECF subfamily)